MATTRDAQNISRMQVLYSSSSSEESVRDAADVAAVRATISAISASGTSTSPPDSVLGDQPFAVTSSTTDPKSVAPSTRKYLRQLTRSANSAAASLACGSILAGHTSETDEYGDVAFWVGSGEYSPGRELDLLSSLGLEHMVGQIQEVKISPDTGLPITVHTPAQTNPAVSRVRELLSSLQDVRIFSVNNDPCVYLLFGRYHSEDQSGFAGLLGLGVQS